MLSVLKSSFLWQFAGGFAVAAVALVSLHPAAQAQRGSASTEMSQAR